MAEIARGPCPECGELIASTAKSCRFCNVVFSDKERIALLEGARKESSVPRKAVKKPIPFPVAEALLTALIVPVLLYLSWAHFGWMAVIGILVYGALRSIWILALGKPSSGVRVRAFWGSIIVGILIHAVVWVLVLAKTVKDAESEEPAIYETAAPPPAVQEPKAEADRIKVVAPESRSEPASDPIVEAAVGKVFNAIPDTVTLENQTKLVEMARAHFTKHRDSVEKDRAYLMDLLKPVGGGELQATYSLFVPQQEVARAWMRTDGKKIPKTHAYGLNMNVIVITHVLSSRDHWGPHITDELRAELARK